MQKAAAFEDQEAEGANVQHEFRKIIGYFDKRALLIATLAVAALGGGCVLLVLIVIKKGVNLFMNAGEFLPETVKMVKTGAWVAAIQIVVQITSAILKAIVSPLFLVDIRKKLYSSLMYADISYFDSVSSGTMVTRLSEGVAYIRDVYVDQLFIACSSIVMALAGFIVAMCWGWKYTLEFICFPIVLGLEIWGGNRLADHVYNKYKEKGSEAADIASSVVTEFRTVKAFDQEMTEADHYKKSLKDEEKIMIKVSFVRAVAKMISLCILAAMVLVFSWYMMRELYREKVEMFAMSVCVTGVVFTAAGIFSALSISDEFQKAKAAARNVVAIIEMKPLIDVNQGRIVDNIHGEVEFRDVSFRYKGCENYALRHLSLKIDAGKTVAFVGESGCGKSTTLQLLQRFYDVDEGQVLIDDIDVREMSPRSLRKAISIVPQGPVLFSMTIADNIRYSRMSATDEEVASAAVTGNAHNFIMELPDNYKTVVAQTSLSGGQKQRICISRAILSPSPILLLDEATAALDTESEQLVQQSLERFRHGKTSIMVAHRLATVVHADTIFVYQNGHVVETGTHQELLDKDGIYAALAKFQLQ